jgi:hypothetical protein
LFKDEHGSKLNTGLYFGIFKKGDYRTDSSSGSIKPPVIHAAGARPVYGTVKGNSKIGPQRMSPDRKAVFLQKQMDKRAIFILIKKKLILIAGFL